MARLSLQVVGVFLCMVVACSASSVAISRKTNNPMTAWLGVSQTRGVVAPITRCGGVATPLQLRISGCEGYCRFQPGTVYDCEKDFMPSSPATSLSLRVEVCARPLCFTILTAEIPNSSVQPGFVYTAKYSIVPNDVFSGQTIQFYAYIYHTDSSLLEVCVSADVDIN
ncbi:uncharacterized protein LOC110844726 [Folsomia candida]|uniref:Uncharacterized protein n=1 Tax=Folsomia candida TaxID=158441 RepID=A0A226EMN6_FOLCA|nr:uncharacterized protein LOC110844726 [Folsomia candida]OXA58945.1 hypothetical protein Fcan01_05235 [Folsomia candida]